MISSVNQIEALQKRNTVVIAMLVQLLLFDGRLVKQVHLKLFQHLPMLRIERVDGVVVLRLPFRAAGRTDRRKTLLSPVGNTFLANGAHA